MTKSALVLVIAGCTSDEPYVAPPTLTEVCLTYEPRARFVVGDDPIVIEQTPIFVEMHLALELTALENSVYLRDLTWSTASGSASGWFSVMGGGTESASVAKDEITDECVATIPPIPFAVSQMDMSLLRDELELTGMVLDATVRGDGGPFDDRTVEVHQVIPVVLQCHPGMTGCN